MTDMVNQSYPHNIDAERAILNILLMDDRKIEEIDNLIAATDFYRPAHAHIYTAIKELVNAHKTPDLITLEDWLRKNDLYDDVGGLAYLVGLQEEVLVKTSIVQYAQMIREKAQLRKIIEQSSALIRECYKENSAGIAQIVDKAEKMLYGIGQDSTSDSGGQMTIWLKRTINYLSELKNYGDGITGIPSGFRALDALTGGFQKSDMIVVGARPSMGKTSFGLSLCVNAAKLGRKVGFYSLEMPGEHITLRIISMESGLEHNYLKDQKKFQESFGLIVEIINDLEKLPIYIESLTSVTMPELRSKIRKAHKEYGLEMVVVDYLGLIKPTKDRESKQLEIADISASLKSLAKELNMPIVVLSQLSRGVESRVDKHPMMSDLRDSGAIEQDADLVMFLYREFQYNQEADPYKAEVVIAKHRNGPTGNVVLNFIPQLAKFEEWVS